MQCFLLIFCEIFLKFTLTVTYNTYSLHKQVSLIKGLRFGALKTEKEEKQYKGTDITKL